MYDLLIRNGLILDGTGGAPFVGDVGLVGERIEAIGALPGPALRTLDANGYAVTPGFIDMHSHTDYLLLVNPTAESKIAQGVTTEVCGNCGFSPGPWLSELTMEQGRRRLEHLGIEPEWQRLSEFMQVLDRHAFGVNFVTFVGHGALRGSVLGYENRAATAAEMDRMKGILAEEMEEGAVGLSSGLIYPPGCYCGTDELTELSRVVAEHNGVYSTHMRNEGDRLVESVEEAITIGRGAECGVQISHHKACGRRNWGKIRHTLGMIEQARAAGQDVTADQYPYTATSTTLSVLLPKWAFEGGNTAALARVRDTDTRRRIQEEMAADEKRGVIGGGGGWECVGIAGVHGANHFAEGLNVAQVAETWGIEPAEAALRLLDEAELSVGMIHHVISEADVEEVMTHPTTMIGSDGVAGTTTGALATGKPHPRSFGTFPRVLGHYVRERRVLSLPEAIARMTGMPARKLRLDRRGLLAPGYFADVVVFDPAAVQDTATFTEPRQLPRGIHAVFVNGVAAVEEGRITGKLGGRVLRRT
jgi:N-acyl-D-amino-acid deacylase